MWSIVPLENPFCLKFIVTPLLFSPAKLTVFQSKKLLPKIKLLYSSKVNKFGTTEKLLVGPKTSFELSKEQSFIVKVCKLLVLLKFLSSTKKVLFSNSTLVTSIHLEKSKYVNLLALLFVEVTILESEKLFFNIIVLIVDGNVKSISVIPHSGASKVTKAVFEK